jgi:hypothetical protein
VTEEAFIEALEAAGLKFRALATKPFDKGTKLGVAVTVERDGQTMRHAVILPRGSEPERGFPALLSWATQ